MVDVDTEIKNDMTPMIDVVFQLIIFFVLVIDLTQQDLEALKLPEAEFAVPDENPPEGRPIINIMQDGRMVHRMADIFLPSEEENFQTLRETLARFAVTMNKEEFAGREIPSDPLLIRADMWTDFHWVARLMEQCGQPGIQIWKLELALAEPKD